MEADLEPEAEFPENDDNWISDLKDALLTQPDFSTIRNVAKNRPFPKNCRAQAWLVLLGVAHKPDPFIDFDGLYDLPEQNLIRLQCQQIVEKLGNETSADKLAVTSDLESILTLYCKQRRDAECQNDGIPSETAASSGDEANSSRFDDMENGRKKSGIFEPENGWSDVLQLLAALNLSKHQLFNVFYAVTTKYIPRGCMPNGRPFDLFRLLLLYHDPQLCSFLDTRKLTPDYYANNWFNSLFASTCSLDVALVMWDVYLQQADPFLLFFMALVILVNAKEQILSMADEPKEAIAETIRQFPSQLQAPDIEDFCQLALYYSTRTPQSFRRDYHGPLYGSHFMADGFENVTVHTLLCLPVSIQELLKSSSTSSPSKRKRDSLDGANGEEEDDVLRYFVVDGRPPKQYNNGHLPGAFSIDASLIVNDPAQFHSLARTLDEIKTRTQLQSHWCLMGSGRDEEDKYIHMVASYFLQRNTPYVSIARGGYQALHETLKETLATRLKSHSVKGCVACNEIGKPASNLAGATESSPKRSPTPKETVAVGNGDKNRASITEKSWSIFSRVKDVVKNKSVEVKDYVLVAAAGTGGEAGGGSPVHRHVGSQERNVSGKKTYRNLPNVFSISDDASDDEFGSDVDDDGGGADDGSREKVRLKEWLKRTEIIANFECQEIDEQAVVHPGFLALTKTHLYVLRELADQAGFAVIKSRRNLSSIQRITSKRQHPEVLTFKYGFELAPDRQKITGAERFWVPKAGDCAKAVKTAIVQLQESTLGRSGADDGDKGTNQRIMPTKPIDVTVAWGRPRGPLDTAMSDWWESIYQDMVPSFDGSRLYFLFDKSQEEPESGQDYHALLVFDPQQRRFVREIPLPLRGCQSKFMYLTSPDTVALFTQIENPQGPGYLMTLYSVKINPDGLSIGECKPVLGPLLVGEEYIAAQWQDSIVLLSGPAMTVWRVSLTQGVMYSYTVPGASLKYYYDAVVGQNGVIYLFATRQEGTFDFAQVHTVDIEGRSQMQPFNTYPDQYFGFPPLRKQCALSIWKDRLYVAGGEFEDPYRGGQTTRLDDFWYLNLSTLVWQKVQVQLPYRMIEPRMHALEDGQCYLWSDCDNTNGCYSRDKHIHVIHLWLGAPSLQEHAWRSVCETNPYIMTANVDYLRNFYRLPEKFLWRVYMAQLGPPGGHQAPPPGYHQPPPGYEQPPPGYNQQQPAQAWGTAPGFQQHGGGGHGHGHKDKKDCVVS